MAVAPTAGTLVGGGANPTVRVALSIKETTSTGPVGAPGVNTSANIHFLGASTTSGGAPTDSMILYPSNGWQTVTISAGRTKIANATNVLGTVLAPTDGNYYGGTWTSAIKVYPFKTVNSTTVYSVDGAQSATFTSNDVFVVKWTWDAVAGAEGYRLLMDLNGAGYNSSVDVTTNEYLDTFVAWGGVAPVTPTSYQAGPSIIWNGTPAGATVIPTQWGILEALAFSIADPSDSGPYDLYIDNIQNGSTVFQTFETAPAGTTDYAFRVPSFSGTTSGNLLATPNVGQVVNNVTNVDSGNKAFRVRFQWQATTANKWLRLTTSGVNNPQLNLDEPISFRLLMQPTGATVPPAPPAPTLSAQVVAGQTVLNWTGGHRLQTSVDVPGTYTNVPQGKTTSNWTNIWNGNFLSPWTNNYTEPTRFFRLMD